MGDRDLRPAYHLSNCFLADLHHLDQKIWPVFLALTIADFLQASVRSLAAPIGPNWIQLQLPRLPHSKPTQFSVTILYSPVLSIAIAWAWYYFSVYYLADNCQLTLTSLSFQRTGSWLAASYESIVISHKTLRSQSNPSHSKVAKTEWQSCMLRPQLSQHLTI